MVGSSLGFLILSSVLGVVVGRWKLGILPTGATDSDIHLFVADVVKSFDTVDRGVLDGVLSSLAFLPGFVMPIFEYHAHVRLRFKLAAGLGEPWTSDGRDSSRLSFEYDVHCCFVSALVSISCCSWRGSASIVC